MRHPAQAVAGFLLLSVAAFAADAPQKLPAPAAQGPAASNTAMDDIQVPSPPFTEGIFPCSSCHDNKAQKVNPKRRQLAMHDEITLKHGPESRWCLDCHDPLDRDKLRLVNGDKIPFTVSYQLCGQCHGDKIRDWRVGIHGKRTGRWNGAKQYLLCVHCHNPHAPRFKHLKPMAPPIPPERIQVRKTGAP